MNDADVSRYEAERRELREDNKRMWEDLVRLRKWKESVEEENVELLRNGPRCKPTCRVCGKTREGRKRKA
jgi:hypothetical protein